jgi:hypothetical protein
MFVANSIHPLCFDVAFIMLVAVSLYTGDYNSGLCYETRVYTRCKLEPIAASLQMSYE